MRIKVEFEVELGDIPTPYTNEDLDLYLRYSFREISTLALNNPFNVLDEPQPVFGTFAWDEV